MTKLLAGLHQIIDCIDAVLVDQYGVLHDGKTPVESAIDCLKELRNRNIPVVAVTNSGRLKEANWQRMISMGFTKDIVNDIVTSGEVGRRVLREMIRVGDLNAGDKILCLSRENDCSMAEGLGLIVQALPTNDTKSIVISGIMPENFSREYYKQLLKNLASKNAFAICANPDLVMYTNGPAAFGPGVVAADFETAGGRVLMVGKPSIEIFSDGLEALGNPDPTRTLMIGDSPHHDIAGGNQAGCLTLLIKGGIQSETGSETHKADFVMQTLRF